MVDIERIHVPVSKRQAFTGYEQLYAIEASAWVWHPDAGSGADSVVIFENRFELESATEFTFHLSADQRYELFIDGEFVAIGPDRSDVEHWAFKTYRVRLEPGPHVFTVEAWWLSQAPAAQLTHRPGFIFHAEGELGSVLDTGKGHWTVRDITDAWIFEDLPYRTQKMVGRAQTVLGEKMENPEFNEVEPAVIHEPLRFAEWGAVPAGWKLYPSELKDQIARTLVPGSIIAVIDGGFDVNAPLSRAHFEVAAIADYQRILSADAGFLVAPHTDVSLIWDLDDYYCGYSLADLSGSAGARVSMTWFESPFRDPAERISKWKDDRREWDGKYIRGLTDTFACDRIRRRAFRNCWFRSGNYICVTIHTEDQPLTLHSLGIRETRYPLENEALFVSDDPTIEHVITMATRSMQMCAHETFYDCPHYEQLMYTADTQVIAQTARAMSPDRRLINRSMRLLEWSRRWHGMINSSYPSGPQKISTFSLYWIMMLWESAYWDDDPELIRELLPAMRDLLQKYLAHRNADGLLMNPPGWAFVDTVPEWSERIYAPPGDPSGVINLMFQRVLTHAADLESHFGEREFSGYYSRMSEELLKTIRGLYWCPEESLFADDLEHQAFSEHAQILAVLNDGLPASEVDACWDGLLNHPRLSHTQTFWKYFLFEAYARRGRGDLILKSLDVWHEWLANGFRTAPEMYEPSRSDCHGWGGHPLFHLQATVAGVRPASPGFRTVRIAPSFGHLRSVKTRMPHPKGWIEVTFTESDDRLRAEITLPEAVPGSLVFGGNSVDLAPGFNACELPGQAVSEVETKAASIV